MDKVIHLINPRRNPFLVLSNIIGKETAPQARFDWMEDENFISRHFTATIYKYVHDTTLYSVGLVLNDPRDWQAIEAIPNESGYDTGRDIQVKLIGRTSAEEWYAYIKKSAIVDGKTIRKLTSDGTTEIGAAKKDMIQLCTSEADADGTGIDAEVITASGTWTDAELVDVYVYTPNFMQGDTEGEVGYSYGGFKEGSGSIPDTRKTVANYYNYTQIFKTSLQVTGTMLANKSLYGGPERARLRAKKAMQHASDIEWAIMFNGGGVDGTNWGLMDTTENPRRITKGLGVGQAQATAGWIYTYNGEYNTDMQFDWSDGDYDDMVTITEKLFDDTDTGSETKLVYASKKWLTLFSRLFYQPGSSVAIQTQIGNLATKAGLRIKTIETAHGDLVITSHPFLRGPYEDYAVIIDPANVTLCPHAERDTKLRTNIQTPDLDGVMDEYLTEIGMKVMHEHTHAILKIVP